MQDELIDLILRGSVDVIEKELLLEKMSAGKLNIKFGIDPTASRVHIGRAATIRKLHYFQQLGHNIQIIIGDFTAQIGDSSDKTAERPQLSAEEVAANMADYKDQILKIFDIDSAQIHFNNTWFKEMDLTEFFKLQQMFSVAQMIERDNFAKRYAGNNHIGLHEFSYALLQGYDSVKVKADVEIGGTDQLFNLLAGRTIQKNYAQQPQQVITYDLLLGTDGRKMSSTWDNCIYIDDEPDDMYGKVMSIDDSQMKDYYRLVTEISSKDLNEVNSKIDSNEDPRGLKAKLANLITAMYHDQEAADQAAQSFDSQFKDGKLPSEIDSFKTTLGKTNTVEILFSSGLVSSKSEARRLLQQNGVRLNQNVVTDEEIVVKEGDVLQAGKRKYVRLVG